MTEPTKAETQSPAAAVPYVPRPDWSIGEVARRLGPLGVLAFLSAALPGIGGLLLLGYRQPVADWLASHGTSSLLVYALGFALTSGFALLPTYAQAIIGGYAFRLAWGTPAALAGFLGGALIGYVVARAAGGDRALRLIQEDERAKAVYQALVGAGFWRSLLTVTLLRLPPNSPFAMTNLVMAATRVPLGAYLLGTLLGMLPRTVLMIYVGSQLKSLAEMNAPAWWFWVGLLVALAVIGIIGQQVNQAITRTLRDR